MKAQTLNRPLGLATTRVRSSHAAIVVLVALTAASAVLHGRLTNRWGRPSDLVAAAEKLDSLPSEFGHWRLQASDQLDDGTAKMLEHPEYVLNTYLNEQTRQTINMTILLGHPGPISVHTPEVCYSSRDFTQRGKPQRVKLQTSQAKDHEFWVLTFQSNNVDAGYLRVYYAWSLGDTWAAAKGPRFAYAGQPLLFKIQLAGPLPPDTDPDASDPCRDFLTDFLPAADPVLFGDGTE